MSPPIPTTARIAANIVSQMEAALSQSVPLLPKAFIRVLAAAIAGVVVLLYKYCGFVFLQLFVEHASDEETTINGKKIRPLRQWGRLVGAGDPNPATRAELSVRVPVTNQVGSLKAGSQLLCSSTNVIYTTAADTPLNEATVLVTIRAASDQDGGDGSGTIGNLEPGDIVSFANPLPNVATDAVVEAVAVAGVAAETVDAYRARVIRKFQRRPQGGAYADYEEWGSVPGIVHVYPYTGAPGEVDIYAEADFESSGSIDGIPTGPQLTAVRDAIETTSPTSGLATVRPANAAINVYPITRVGFALTVGGLTPDTPETRAAIEDGATEHLLSREPYIVGLSTLPRDDSVTSAALAGIVDGIVNAAGASVTYVTLLPGPAYTLGKGEKAKLAGVSYV